MSIALLLMLTACADKPPVYTDTEVTLTAWGVDQALTGYVDGEFVDGYDLYFDHWITTFTDVHLGEGGDRSAVYVVDWTQLEGPVELGRFPLGEGTHELGLSTVPAAEGATELSAIDPDLWALMLDGGYTHLIQGRAEGGGGEYSFVWPMEDPGVHTPCVNGETGESGLTITAEEVDEQTPRSAQIDFHLDHLFYDWLDTEAADMRFEVFAAWADPVTGVVDWGDVAQINAGALADRDGGAIEDADERQLSYSNAGLNMQDYLRYSVQSMVHMNGQGACEHTNL